MRWIGINYDVGTRYGTGADASWSCAGYDVETRLVDDLAVIADQLHCNTVQLFGSDLRLLERAAHVARAHDLDVWLQPRLVDASRDQHLDQLAEAAAVAEAVRAAHGGLTMSVGVELSLFLEGFLDGRTLAERMRKIFDPALDHDALDAELDDHLAAAETTVRRHFTGAVTYGAGMWEPVRWDRRFDLVGIDLYVRPLDEHGIMDEISRHQRYGKPVVATEYGCVTHEGGLRSFGADVVDWEQRPPRLAEDIRRDEAAQAEGIARQFEALHRSGASGALCFAFLEPRYSGSGGHDLDAASFGIARAVGRGHPGASSQIEWSPKMAFGRLADLHRSEAMR